MVRHATSEPSRRDHFDEVCGNLQAANRLRQALVVREDDDLSLLRHRGEHASETINLARIHRLDRIVDHHEAEGRFRQQHARQKQAERKRVDLSLAHHAECLAIGSVDADVQNEVTAGGRTFELQAVERYAAVLPERCPHLRGPLRDGTKPLGPDPVRLRVEPLLRARQVRGITATARSAWRAAGSHPRSVATSGRQASSRRSSAAAACSRSALGGGGETLRCSASR